jgi:hypothetical protein
MKSLCRIFLFSLLLFLSAARLSAHAFLDHSNPSVGGKVHSAPAGVRMWFTEKIDPARSSIEVFNATGKQVDKKDTHSDRFDHSLLQVSLSRLGPGTYKVIWRVMSADTHVTNGDFKFQVTP